MVEILKFDDVDKIEDIELKKYAQYSLDRLPDDYCYPEYGYFIIIENLDEIEGYKTKFTNFTLPSFENGLLDMIEIVEHKANIVEIVILIDNDFSVSLIMYQSIISDKLIHF